jgi:Universal stress protein family
MGNGIEDRDRSTVVIAYDGSNAADAAIAQAGLEFGPGRDAVVVCVWQCANVGFLPIGSPRLRAMDAHDVRRAAEFTAAYGAKLARRAGFASRSLAIPAAPRWEGIVAAARMYDSNTIVTASHDRVGLFGRHRALGAYIR